MISVIVPVFNSSKYLKECIDSILNQSFKDFELILVDDGSTDDSLDICNSYVDKRVRVIEENHKGVSNARNVGIQCSLGKYICFVDSDDVLNSRYLEIMYQYMDDSISYVECNFKYFTDCIPDCGVNDSFLICDNKEMFYRLYSKNGVRTCVIWNKLYQRSLFNELRFEDVCNEDEFLIHKLISCSSKIVVLEEVLYYYRIRKMSRQRNISSDRIEFLRVFDERKEYFLDNQFHYLNYIAMLDTVIYLYFVFYRHGQFSDCKRLYCMFLEKYDKSYRYSYFKKFKYLLFQKFPKVYVVFMFLSFRYRYV